MMPIQQFYKTKNHMERKDTIYLQSSTKQPLLMGDDEEKDDDGDDDGDDGENDDNNNDDFRDDIDKESRDEGEKHDGEQTKDMKDEGYHKPKKTRYCSNFGSYVESI